MATSTTTLLQLTNLCLTSVGERPTTSVFLGFPAAKTVDAITTALQDVATLNDWGWNRVSANALSWSTDTATIPDIHRLLGVTFRLSANQSVNLKGLPREEYPWLDGVAGGPPQFFTLSDTNKIKVYPYPVSAPDQQKILFHYVPSLSFVPSDATLLPIPERFIPLLKLGALVYLCQSHLDDMGASRFYKEQFDELGAKLRLREPGMGVGTRNMYRRAQAYRPRFF